MIVSISKVSKRYNTLWVLKVSGEFSSQNVIAVIGRNGEGKSTLVKIVSGVIKADSGRVSIDGEQPHDPCAKARMAVSFQSPSLFSGFSLKENLIYHAKFFGLKPSASEINEVLSDVGLLDFSNKKFESL
jgi:ABC-type multidrug transport system ATPase subunit